MILSVWNDTRSRASLGRVFDLARRSHHDDEVWKARSKYGIGSNATWGLGTTLSGDGAISIGEDTYLGELVTIVAHPQEAFIRIGRGCAISHNIQIRTEGYRTDIPLSEARRAGGIWSNITIGDGVWIGANVFICGGVTIGDNSVVGANGVVTRDVPPNSIVGGVPARVIKLKVGSAITERRER